MDARKFVSSEGGELGLLGVVGLDRILTGTEIVTLLEWSSTSKVAIDLELLMQPSNQNVGVLVPAAMKWAVELAHGDSSYGMQDPVSGLLPGVKFWAAMPANGVRARFCCRGIKVFAQVQTLGQNLGLKASLQPCHGMATPLPQGDAVGVVGVPFLPMFPLGAREFRMHCVNPLREVSLFGLDPGGTLIDTQPVGTYADWTPIPLAAAFWNADAAFTDIVTACYR